MGGFARDRDGTRRPVGIPRHAIGISHSDGRYSRGCITSRRTHLMPNYEATPAEYAKYGANLNIWKQIQLLSAWSPLIGYAQRFVNEADPYKKSIIAAEGLEWVASKTNAQLDDELVKLIAAILRTEQGENLVRWALGKVEASK
jgi:hypothetical protein